MSYSVVYGRTRASLRAADRKQGHPCEHEHSPVSLLDFKCSFLVMRITHGLIYVLTNAQMIHGSHYC